MARSIPLLPSDPTLRLRRIASVALFFLFGIMITGALVRLTNSGLGCPNWPSCHGDRPIPALSYHPLVEFANRVWSTPTTIFSIWATVLAFRLPERRRDLRISSAGVLVGVLCQIVLGGITVREHLHPLLVGSHFALSILILAVATYTVFAAARPPQRLVRRSLAPVAGLVVVLSCGVAVVTGILTTAASPHSGALPTSPVPRYGNFSTAVALHAHCVFAFSIMVVVLTIWKRRTAAGARDMGWLIALIAVQIGLGEYQYRNGLPWGVVLAHVACASLVWIVSVWIAVDACTEDTDLPVLPGSGSVDSEIANRPKGALVSSGV